MNFTYTSKAALNGLVQIKQLIVKLPSMAELESLP